MVSVLALFFNLRYFAIASLSRSIAFGELAHLLFLLFLWWTSYDSLFLTKIVSSFMFGYIIGLMFPKTRFRALSLHILRPKFLSFLALSATLMFLIFSVYLINAFGSNISQFRYLLFDANSGLAISNNAVFTIMMYFIWTTTGLYLVGVVTTEKPMLLFVAFLTCGMIFLSRNIIILAIVGLLLRISIFKKGVNLRYFKRSLFPVLIILFVVLGNRGLFRSMVGFFEYNTTPLTAFEILANDRSNFDWPWYSSFRGLELALNPFLEIVTRDQRTTSQQIVGPVYDYAITIDGAPWNAFYSGFSTPYFSLGLTGVFLYGLFFRLTYQIRNKRIQYLHWLLFYFGFRQVFFEDPASIFLVLLWLL